jgi:large subunit ribosomal protein L22
MAEKKKYEGPKRSGRKPAAKAEAAPAKKPGAAARLLRRRAPQPVSAVPVEARAVARYQRLSPQKARLVIDLIRGREVGYALHQLQFTRQRAARPIEKVLRSAIANAEQKSETLDVDRLYVKHAVVNEGPRWKRIRPAPFGRAYGYQRRTAHIEIAVAERRAAPAPAPARPETSKEATA